jgi:hypothetical protein
MPNQNQPLLAARSSPALSNWNGSSPFAGLSQPDLPLTDPLEPRILPQDRRALFIVAWLGKTGKLNKQKAFEVDEAETVLPMLHGQPDMYLSQCFFDRPFRRHANVMYGTHSYVDLDTYRVPFLARLPRDEQVREIRLLCDATGTPQPSAVIGSGRGLYLKWYFAQPTGRADVGRMVAANRALQRRLSRFGADPAATDCARVLRVTGSQHSAAQRLVELLHLEHRDGQTITFDFDAFTKDIAPPIERDYVAPVTDMGREVRRWIFTREAWHWNIVEDCYRLAVMRWGGVVPEGWRDLFGHVIACQVARVVPFATLYLEIVAAVARILPPDYLAHNLRRECSSLLERAKLAAATGNPRLHYAYGKARLIELLQITPAEERHMLALISDAEVRQRNVAAKEAARRATGVVERAEYEAHAAGRASRARTLADSGLSWAEVADRMELPSAEAARKLARRAV